MNIFSYIPKEKTILNERMDISGEDMERALNNIVSISRKKNVILLKKYATY